MEQATAIPGCLRRSGRFSAKGMKNFGKFGAVPDVEIEEVE